MVNNKFLSLGLALAFLAGCATSSNYVHYTDQAYPPKDQFYPIQVYPASQPLGAVRPYYVIGKVSVEGMASNGVSPGSLTAEAKVTARQKGADAIINAKTEVFRYYYGDTMLRFVGELVVYAASNAK